MNRFCIDSLARLLRGADAAEAGDVAPRDDMPKVLGIGTAVLVAAIVANVMLRESSWLELALLIAVAIRQHANGRFRLLTRPGPVRVVTHFDDPKPPILVEADRDRVDHLGLASHELDRQTGFDHKTLEGLRGRKRAGHLGGCRPC